MSSNTYTLKIDIDDSKIRDLEKRILAIMGMNGTQRSGIGGAMMGVTGQDKKGSGIAKNIGKLSLIAIGVGSILGLVKKLTGMIIDSSPMLQQMLKLLNFGFMLILRPIGDFIGFFLKPMIMWFIRDVALPWYKSNVKKAMDKGTEEGTKFADNPMLYLGKKGALGLAGLTLSHLDEIQNAIEGAFMQVGLTVQTWVNALPFPDVDWTSFNLFLDKFSLENLPKIDWASIKTFLDNFSLENLPKIDWTWVKNLISNFGILKVPTINWTWIRNLISNFGILKVPTINWTWLRNLISNFGILKVPTFSWEDLNLGLDALKEEVEKFITAVTDVFTFLISKIPGVGGGGGNNFIDLNFNGIDDAVDLENAGQKLTDTLNDILKGND
tara:strand:- start:3094 stop:4242 length:1149 start_codon:yes stop_codon:yes gene_type:complete